MNNAQLKGIRDFWRDVSGTTTQVMKRAIKRTDAGELFIDCGCGQRLPMPNAFKPGTTQCSCGTVYNGYGWIQEGA